PRQSRVPPGPACGAGGPGAGGSCGPGAEAQEPDVALLPRLLRLYNERRGEEATREARHEPPASKRMAERFASDRVGHRPQMENARLAGSLAEAGQVPRPGGRGAEFPRASRARTLALGLTDMGPVQGGPGNRAGRVQIRRSCAEVRERAGDHSVALT